MILDRLNQSRQDLSFDIYYVPIWGEQRNLIFENVPERHYLKSEYGTVMLRRKVYRYQVLVLHAQFPRRYLYR